MSLFSGWLARRAKQSLDPESVKKLERVEELVGFEIEEPELFFKALRHRSRTADKGFKRSDTYEQLEFLGDAVLDLAVSEILFDHFPKEDEGFMTKMRARIVRGEALATYARALRLNEIVEIGNRAKNQHLQQSTSILADVFEALVGAIYRTKGYPQAMLFIRKVVSQEVDFEKLVSMKDNFKSTLLEYAQSKRLGHPDYRVLSETGPDHKKNFVVQAMVNGEVLGKGQGSNKKRAEQKAAKEALQVLGVL